MPEEKNASLKLEIVERISSLAAAGLGLVAALAWNDAIQGFFAKFVSEGGGLAAKFIYAFLVTVLVVVIIILLGRLTNKLKNKLNK